MVSEGLPSESQIEKLLDDVVLRKLDRELHPALAKAKAAFDAGACGAAFAAAGKLLKQKQDPDKAVIADATYLREAIQKNAAVEQRLIEAVKSDARKRYGRLMVLRYEYDGLPESKWAQQELRGLAKVERVKRDKKQWRALETAIKREMKINGKVYELKRTLDLYSKTIGLKSTSVPGKIAKRRRDALR